MKKTAGLVIAFVVLGTGVSLLAWLTAGAGGGSVEDLARSSDPNEREAAAERLGRSKDDKAVKMLRDLARDKNGWVAVKAVRSLGARQTDTRRQTLAEMVTDRSLAAGTRGAAAATYGSFEGADSGLLTETLTKDPDPKVREGAAKGLVRLRKPETLPQLVEALSDSDAKVRAYANAAIHNMIVRRYPFDPKAAPPSQQQTIEKIKSYLRKCDMLK